MEVSESVHVEWVANRFRDLDGNPFLSLYDGTIRDDRKRRSKISLVNLGIQPTEDVFVSFEVTDGEDVFFHEDEHDSGVPALKQRFLLKCADPSSPNSYHFLSFSGTRMVKVQALRIAIKLTNATASLPSSPTALFEMLIGKFRMNVGHTISPPPPEPGDKT